MFPKIRVIFQRILNKNLLKYASRESLVKGRDISAVVPAQLKSDFEAKSFHMKQIEKWLKATRGWILIRKYFYEQKYRKWEMDLLQILHRIQDPCKEFSKTVFGNPAIHSILKISSKTIQHYTSNHWKIEQSWLNYRQKIIESQLSTKTTDEIKSIQNKLCIRKMTQQMLCRYSNMKSNEEQEDHDHNDENSVSESNKLKHKQHGLTKYPFSVNHPLHTHEQQLMNALNEIKTGLNLNLFELNSKANDLHKLLLLIGRIKFDLKNEYLKYTQMSLNELDKKQQQLTHFSNLLGELKEKEATELKNLTSEARKISKTRAVLMKELKFLRISQNVNNVHHLGYFDYRYNLALCKL